MIQQYSPPQEALKVIYSDDQLLLVDKPAGLLSVPGKGPELADCLIDRLRFVFPQVLLVHRLDRDTSGIMVFALTAQAQRHLGQQFEKRQTRKTYVAMLWGKMEQASGQVDLPLAVDWPNRPKQRVDHENGRAAVTDWRVDQVQDKCTRVMLYPKTGRSHQLRVHMQEIGHPVMGDPFYATGPARDAPRLMLHAQNLRFRHPDGGAWMSFTAHSPF